MHTQLPSSLPLQAPAAPRWYIPASTCQIARCSFAVKPSISMAASSLPKPTVALCFSSTWGQRSKFKGEGGTLYEPRFEMSGRNILGGGGGHFWHEIVMHSSRIIPKHTQWIIITILEYCITRIITWLIGLSNRHAFYFETSPLEVVYFPYTTPCCVLLLNHTHSSSHKHS